jgi:hypothetical protein
MKQVNTSALLYRSERGSGQNDAGKIITEEDRQNDAGKIMREEVVPNGINDSDGYYVITNCLYGIGGICSAVSSYIILPS